MHTTGIILCAVILAVTLSTAAFAQTPSRAASYNETDVNFIIETQENASAASAGVHSSLELQSSIDARAAEGDPDAPIITGQTQNPEPAKESGEKSGTADINIGVGELQSDAAASGALHASAPGGGASFAVTKVEVRGWDPEKKQAFLGQVKEWAEVKSQQDLENFAAGVLLDEDIPVEEVSFNYGKISLEHMVPGKFLGLFSSSFPARTEVDADQSVKVKFPWYSFLFSKSMTSAAIRQSIEAEISASGAVVQEADAGTDAWPRTARTIGFVHAAFSALYSPQ